MVPDVVPQRGRCKEQGRLEAIPQEQGAATHQNRYVQLCFDVTHSAHVQCVGLCACWVVDMPRCLQSLMCLLTSLLDACAGGEAEVQVGAAAANYANPLGRVSVKRPKADALARASIVSVRV